MTHAPDNFPSLEQLLAMSLEDLYAAAQRYIDAPKFDGEVEESLGFAIQVKMGIKAPDLSKDLYRGYSSPFRQLERQMGKEWHSSWPSEVGTRDPANGQSGEVIRARKAAMPEPPAYVEIRQLPCVAIPIERGTEILPVYYFEKYFAKRYRESDLAPTREVLNLKSARQSGVDFYARLFQKVLCGAALGAPIVAMPSSSTGPASAHGGLRQLISRVKARDLSDTLRRHEDIGPSHLAERRHTAEAHRRSMSVATPQQIKGLDLILLDDVCTQGSTMRAARYLLWKSGANSVTCVALAKTSEGTQRSSGQTGSSFGEADIPF